MKFFPLFVVISFVVFSCKTQEISNTPVVHSALETEKLLNAKAYEMRMKGVDFYSCGNEPSWSLEIDFDKMVRFTSEEFNKDIVVSMDRLMESSEAGDINYEINDDRVSLKIHIKPNVNPFIYDENNKPYLVELKVKKNKDANWHTYQGQGEYFGDLVLHDIWSLIEINGKSVSDYHINEEPFMEIHLDTNRISGFLGCNNFGGQCYFANGKMVVGYLRSTKKACLDIDIEDDFARAIGNDTFFYTVDNGILTLWNHQSKLIFKKRN